MAHRWNWVSCTDADILTSWHSGSPSSYPSRPTLSLSLLHFTTREGSLPTCFPARPRTGAGRQPQILPQTLSLFEIVPSGPSLEYLTDMTDEGVCRAWCAQLLASHIIKTPNMHFLIHSMAVPSYVL